MADRRVDFRLVMHWALSLLEGVIADLAQFSRVRVLARSFLEVVPLCARDLSLRLKNSSGQDDASKANLRQCRLLGP
jgi:hypothetical protein